MIPDLAQEGKAQEKHWAPQPQAPVVMFNNVGKTYGRFQAIGGISLALSGGVTGILGLNGFGLPEPIVTDHPVFIRVRNGTLFQVSHCSEGFVDAFGLLVKKIIRKIYTAQIQA